MELQSETVAETRSKFNIMYLIISVKQFRRLNLIKIRKCDGTSEKNNFLTNGSRNEWRINESRGN